MSSSALDSNISIAGYLKEEQEPPLTPEPELGMTTAPLTSAAFFFASFCKDYTEDFMLCKDENGNDPRKCLKEGRRVTRCAMDLFRKLKAECGEEFKAHWQCLVRNDMAYEPCRKEETSLNACALAKLGLKKHIPNSVEDRRKKQ